MKILSVTSEIFPLIKTGGLADVTGSLPKALKAHGVFTQTLVPGYPGLLEKLQAVQPLIDFTALFGERASLLRGRHEGLDLLVLHAPALYNRPGGPYVDENGQDFGDNWKRFAALSAVAAEVADGLIGGWRPDVVHTHDWQTALTSVYMRHLKKSTVPSLLTIHNLAFQGQFPAWILRELGLPPDVWDTACLEYHGDVCYLKGGLMTADAITTVSPTYSREILTSEFGMGLDGVLAQRLPDLAGIVNGIDMDIWDPAADPHIPMHYDTLSIKRRRVNRAYLAGSFGLDCDAGPIFAVVSRLTWQKGVDMLCDLADYIVWQGGKIVVLGQGDKAIEHQLAEAATRHPGRIAVRIGYDEPTAHLIHGGADVMIQPSRFEPCGLTQLYAMRYGAVPVVARTGGLSETIIDANDAAMSARVATGFQFHPINTEELRHAIDRAFAAFSQPRMWARLQHQGMKTRFSWERSAERYAALYDSLTQTHQMLPEAWAARATAR